MDITVAIVTYNAAGCIQACLESIVRQSPHGGAAEIIVVDGCSSDGTQRIVQAFSPKVRLLENPGRTIASNRNAALREARYPYLAFTDADCVVPENWLASLAKAFETLRASDPGLVAVGGGNCAAQSDSPFLAALEIALDSFLGSMGSVQGRRFADARPVKSLACLNALYDRAALNAIGGFDERLGNMCEDADINYRLGQAGRTLWFVPGADVEHRARANLGAWCRNMYAYGIGRARIMRKHRTVFSPLLVLPLLFLPALVLAAAAGMVWPWAFLAWLYVPAAICAGYALTPREKRRLGWRVGLILLGTHLCYSAGLWRGLVGARWIG